MSAAEDPLAPAAAIPPLDDFDYQVQRFIETDSKMSAVLLATTARQRPVVLKIARVDQRARAEANREAIRNSVLWLRRLGPHDGLVRLHPIVFKPRRGERTHTAAPVFCATLRQWAGEPDFLVMEYLAGGSLRDYVGARPLGIDAALWIARGLAESLAYIHQQGCVHRDIKPENILFRNPPPADGSLSQLQPVLVDFGVAAARGERRLVSGSRLWMAPELQDAYEQAPLPVDPAWDVYALGLILCYMITGRRPRRRSYEYSSVLAYRAHTLAVLEQGLQNRGGKTTADRSDVRLAQLITAMLARNPADRPAAHEVAATAVELLAALGGPLSWQARLHLQWARSRRLPPGKQLQLALVAALVAGLLLGGLAGLLISLPAAVNARDGAPATAPPAPALLQDQIPPTAALGPEPTRVPLTPTATQPPPTLVPLPTLRPAEPPPTLAPFTPVSPARPSAAAAVASATATRAAAMPPPAPTRTPAPAVFVPTRRGATPAPAANEIPTPAVREAAPELAPVELLAPETGTRSDHGKVEFSWRAGVPPADEHCYELVFWNPNNPADKRSPTGAGKATRRRVDFTLLFNSSDPLLRSLAQSDRDFNWGVRIVACSAPRTVLQDVKQVRSYSYKGQ